MRKNQTFAYNFKKKTSDDHLTDQYSNEFIQKRKHIKNKNDSVDIESTDNRLLSQIAGKQPYSHVHYRTQRLQIYDQIDRGDYLKERLSEVECQNEILNHQRQSLLLRNKALLQRIKLYQQKSSNPQYQKTVKEQAIYMPVFYKKKLDLQSKINMKNITMMRSQELKNDKFQRKNESVYNFQSSNRNYKNYSNNNFVSPSKQKKFDAQLERLRNQKNMLISDLNEHKQPGRSRFSSNLSLAMQTSHNIQSSKDYFNVKINFPIQAQTLKNTDKKRLQYFQQSILNDMKSTQMLSAWKQTSLDNQLTKSQAKQRCQPKNYVIIKCSECKNCVTNHIPSQQKQDQRVYQQDSIRITAPKLMSSKAGQHQQGQKGDICVNKTILLQGSDQKKYLQNKYIEGDRYMQSCLEIMKKPANIVKDLDKKIKKLKTQNIKLREQIGR